MAEVFFFSFFSFQKWRSCFCWSFHGWLSSNKLNPKQLTQHLPCASVQLAKRATHFWGRLCSFKKKMTTVISKRTKILNNEAADGEAGLCCLSDSFFFWRRRRRTSVSTHKNTQSYALFADGSPAAAPCEKNTRITITGSKIRLFLFIILVHFLTCFRN